MRTKKTMLVGTRKGLIVYKKTDAKWLFDSEHFRGAPVSYAIEDSRNGTWWAGLDHGHWGCKLHFSTDKGKSWNEAQAPVYPENSELKPGVHATLKYIWCITPGHSTRPDEIYLGTDPGGLFLSTDGGKTYSLNEGLWNHPSRKDWGGGGRDNPGIHTIIVDPDNPDHLIVGISSAGVLQSYDKGKSWSITNKGLIADFLPDPNAELPHDPHIISHPAGEVQHLWQQNHCGIFRSVDSGKNWSLVSEKGAAAHFGFALAVKENDSETAWVVPATSDEQRVAFDNRLIVCKTVNGGKSWFECTNGLPQENCYDIVYRHSLDIAGDTLAFGTTTGNLFLSDDEGESWRCLNHYLAMVYSLKFAE